jgi:hypothetical protein
MLYKNGKHWQKLGIGGQLVVILVGKMMINHAKERTEYVAQLA